MNNIVPFCPGNIGSCQHPSLTAVAHQDPLFKAKCELLDAHIDLELFSHAALQKGLFRNEEAKYFEQVFFKRSQQEAAKELVLFISQSDQNTLFLDVLRSSVEQGERDRRVTRQQIKRHEELLRNWALLEERQPGTAVSVLLTLSICLPLSAPVHVCV